MKSNKMLLIICLVFNVFLAGCFSFDFGIGIITLPSYRKIKIPLASRDYAEVIVKVDEQNRIFHTLQRIGDRLQMRTINFEGKVINRKLLPLFTESYCAQNKYTVSPDGNNIIYFKYNTKSLHIYDISTSTESVLLKNFASSGHSIKNISYLSETDIIIIASNDEEIGREGNVIFRLHIPSGKATTIISPIYLSEFYYAFSKSKRYLAFWDGRKKYDIYGNIKILDLNTFQIIKTTSNEGESLMSNPSWSPSEKLIAYVKGNSIMTLSLEGTQERTIKEFHENYICYRLKFLDERTILYVLQKEELFNIFSGPRTILLDIDSGKERKGPRLNYNEDIYIVDDGKKILN
jgi:Tol biopolymer transport system component